LQLLCSVYLPVVGYPMVAYPAEFVEYARTQAGSMLERVRTEITEEHSDLEVTTTLTRTEPRTALVEASENVALAVVGCLGSGRVQEVLLGSVALHVSAHARSPVAVVPYDTDRRGGPVLVGVDGAAHSEAAAAFAFDEAALLGVGVVAVMAFDGWTRQGFASRPITFDADESREEYAVISEQLAGLAQRYPDVPVHEHLFRGHAADCLLGYAGHAPLEQQPQLIVVGSRGRGGLTGLLLGSTSHTVIAHAACPVVVVRPADS
jgi:nucleotide-binding universal stress UspA family protein